MRAFAKALCLAAACSAPACALAEAQRLPRLMSTNICADVLALSLADPAQIVSLSRQSQDAKRFSQAAQARRFVVNDATTEDALDELDDMVQSARKQALVKLASVIDEQNDFAKAAQEVRALMFIARFAHDVDMKHEQLAQ